MTNLNYLKMHFTYTGILIFYFITIVWMKTQKKFLEKAKEFYQEGKKVGVGLENARFHRWEMRSYYDKEVYPFLKRFEKMK